MPAFPKKLLWVLLALAFLVPLLNPLLPDLVSDYRLFLVSTMIIAAIAVAGALAYMSTSRPTNPPRMDWPGAVLACAGLFLIVFGFSHAETAGWGYQALKATGIYIIGNGEKLTVALIIVIFVLTVKPAGLFGRVVVKRV